MTELALVGTSPAVLGWGGPSRLQEKESIVLVLSLSTRQVDKKPTFSSPLIRVVQVTVQVNGYLTTLAFHNGPASISAELYIHTQLGMRDRTDYATG